MPSETRQLDEYVKDTLLRYPTVDLVRLLFPDVRVRGRVLCNPLRGERNASFSCFRDRYGLSRWKDWATGESGDNIDFFRKVYPELGYAEAVDRLSGMLLGRSAFVEGGAVQAPSRPCRQAPASPAPVKEEDPVLRIVSDVPLFSREAAPGLVDYVRSRGISDEVGSRYCRAVVFENTNVKGTVRMDPVTGIPITGADGVPEISDGRSAAVAIPNDIGGYSLRVPDQGGRKGFKGCDRAFFSTILAGGFPLAPVVRFVGRGDSRVAGLRYDEGSSTLYVNPSQGFAGVNPWAVRFAAPLLETWAGRRIEGRDMRACVAVLNALNGPVHPVVTVVEGMFDALSVIEIERLSGRGPFPGGDIVVLNSVSHISWAVPFLAMHAEVRSFLDNDLRSSAGQKAFNQMEETVSMYASRCGVACSVRSHSGFFFPHKDVNDYLVASKGLRQAASSVVTGVDDEKKKPAPEVNDSRRRRGRKSQITF